MKTDIKFYAIDDEPNVWEGKLNNNLYTIIKELKTYHIYFNCEKMHCMQDQGDIKLIFNYINQDFFKRGKKNVINTSNKV